MFYNAVSEAQTTLNIEYSEAPRSLLGRLQGSINNVLRVLADKWIVPVVLDRFHNIE